MGILTCGLWWEKMKSSLFNVSKNSSLMSLMQRKGSVAESREEVLATNNKPSHPFVTTPLTQPLNNNQEPHSKTLDHTSKHLETLQIILINLKSK
jgi:hypothetical protein